MADNDFNIKITLDKNSVSQIKAEAQKMSKQLQDIDKQKNNQEKEDAKLTQRVRSRLLSQLVEEEKKAAKEKQRLLKETRDAEIRANKQAVQDAKITARAKQRELEAMFPKEKQKKGMSLFQGLEFGENLTVVSAGITAAIYAITKATQQLFDIAKQGAEYGVLKANFEQMAGGAENARKNIELLYKAAAGNIDKRELMGIANEYKFLGLSIDNTAKLLDGIETRGDAVNMQFRDALDAVNKFVMTGSKRGLLQGLKLNVADVDNVFNQLITSSGKVKETLTDDEVQSFRLQTALTLLGTAAKTTDEILNKSFDNADKLADVENRYKNIKDELSLIASGNIVSYIDKLNKKFEDSSLAIEGNETAITKAADAFKYFTDIIETFAPVNVLGNISLAFNKAFLSITEWIDKGTGSFNTFISAMNVSPNTSWVSSIVGGLQSIYNAARDAYNAIFSVTNAAPNTGVTDLDTRVNNAVKTIQDKTKNYVGFYEYQTLPNPMPPETRGGSKGGSKKETIDAIQLLIEKHKLLIETAQFERNITGQIFNDALNAYKLELDRTKEAKDRLRILKEIESTERSFFEYLDKGKDYKGGIVTGDNSPMRNLSAFTGGTSFIQSKDIEVLIRQFSEPFSNAAESISNIFSDLMSAWEINTETFIGKLVSGFDKILSIVNLIVNTLNAVNAVKGLLGLISSVVPGGGLIAAATGGISGGGRMPMPMMQGNSRPIVNVVVQSEVERTKAIKFFDNNFNAYQNYLRANSY